MMRLSSPLSPIFMFVGVRPDTNAFGRRWKGAYNETLACESFVDPLTVALTSVTFVPFRRDVDAAISSSAVAR